MPAFSRLSNSLGTKLVTLYPGNAEKNIPSHNGIVLVFNPATGILQGVSKKASLTSSLVVMRPLLPHRVS